jgi:predicted nucleic acid-binding protein
VSEAGQTGPVYMLDSFALLAYLNNEPGKPRVEAVLALAENRGCHVRMCWINLGEVLYNVERRRGITAAQRTLLLAESLPLTLLETTRELVLDAAHIKASYPLSYADAFAVAAALHQKATVLTGDPEFKSVEQLVKVEWLEKETRK